MHSKIIILVLALGLTSIAACSSEPEGRAKTLAGDGSEFGVSGYLFNNNLIMYDRAQTPPDGEPVLYPQIYYTRMDVDAYPVYGDLPRGDIRSGGPGIDGIPAITNPKMVTPAETAWGDNDLVVGVVLNGEARAYPHRILWWHEIVNDVVGGIPISITYCPLTGTGLVFDITDINLRLELLPAVETNYATWLTLYPDSQVMSHETGVYAGYTRYPYGSYREEGTSPLFGLNRPLDTRFPAKHVVLALNLEGERKAYPYRSLDIDPVVNDEVGGKAVVVVFDPDTRTAVPFYRNTPSGVLEFEALGAGDDGLPTFTDVTTGSVWNLRGEAVSGELAGQTLTQVPSHTAFWFAWAAFWPDTGVWGEETP